MTEQAGIIAGRVLALDRDRPVRIAVDGFCAAGKTTFADKLADELTKSGRPVIRVCTDDFQNPPEIRGQLGENSPEGFYRHAMNFASIQEKLLEPLDGPDNFSYRTSTYDIRNMRPNLSPLYAAEIDSLMVIDGLFLLVPELHKYWDFTIFVDAPFEVCIARAKRRNQESFKDAGVVEQRYRERYVPGYQLYLDEIRPKELADSVVTSDD